MSFFSPPYDTVAPEQMESIKAVHLCSFYFTGVEINTVYLLKMSMYRNKNLDYIHSHMAESGLREAPLPFSS